MIRHVAMFAWHPEVTPQQVRELASGLEELPPLMRGLREYQFGPDAGLVEGNADFAVVAEFNDGEAYLAYRHHPAHQDLVNRMITPMTRQRMSIQLEI
jgi:hypothetical protein